MLIFKLIYISTDLGIQENLEKIIIINNDFEFQVENLQDQHQILKLKFIPSLMRCWMEMGSTRLYRHLSTHYATWSGGKTWGGESGWVEDVYLRTVLHICKEKSISKALQSESHGTVPISPVRIRNPKEKTPKRYARRGNEKKRNEKRGAKA